MPANANAVWSDDLLAITKALYEGGKHSARQIALAIGNGKSRNAVIGVALRQGWHNPNPQKGGTRKGEKRPRASRIRIWKSSGPLAPLQLEEIPKPENFLGLTIQELTARQCRFADGDGPFFFCGQPTQAGSSYCAYHHRVCWEKPARRPERPFVSRQNF